MAYNVNLSNGDLLTIVEDGTADISSTSVALVGKNFSGYGEYINENFVHLTENFAGESAPSNQLVGQLWYQSNTNELKIWDGAEWASAGKPTILNDNISSTPQFLTFVAASSGTPDFKVAASKGIIYIPSLGAFGLGATNPTSRLTVSINSNATLPSGSPNENVSVHIHGDNGESQTVLLDSYGGTGGTYSTNNASNLTFRRTNGSSVGYEAVRTNDIIGTLGGQAYNASSYSGTRVGVSFVAAENWSAGSNGTKIVFQTTPNGSTLTANAVGILGDKTLECYGNLKIGGDFIALGAVRAGGDVTAFYTSDERLKTNIQPIESALNKVSSLDGVTFDWNELAVDKDPSIREAGVIAQQVQKVLPEAVTERDNGYLAVRYEKLVPLLIEAIKELKEEISVLKAKA